MNEVFLDISEGMGVISHGAGEGVEEDWDYLGVSHGAGGG